VHGGLLPDDSFPEIVGREEMLTLRDVVRGDEEWRAARDDDPPESRVFWAEAWNGNRFVVYGHTPRPGVVRHPRALGIDTGCVYGWSLTAAIRSEDGSWTTHSVPAQRAWSER
jgi:diadenosine tetraphosphatase ApaH/serine/threonine PP2A family protein phosphatase